MPPHHNNHVIYGPGADPTVAFTLVKRKKLQVACLMTTLLLKLVKRKKLQVTVLRQGWAGSRIEKSSFLLENTSR